MKSRSFVESYESKAIALFTKRNRAVVFTFEV